MKFMRAAARDCRFERNASKKRADLNSPLRAKNTDFSDVF